MTVILQTQRMMIVDINGSYSPLPDLIVLCDVSVHIDKSHQCHKRADMK